MNESILDSTTQCRSDCRYYSTYTNTCDYTLLMYQTRGCSRDACTKFAQRTGTRRWSRVRVDPEDGLYIAGKEKKMILTPEPPIDIPDDGTYITADCGHEIYDGEEVFEQEDGQTKCAECLDDRFREMSITERAELLGCERHAVYFPKTKDTVLRNSP